MFCASESDAAVAGTRVEFVKKWARRALELEEDEKKLKCSMDALVARAVKQKRILLFEEMLQSSGIPDMGVADELKCGSDLTGQIPYPGMLPGKFEPALITEKKLSMNAARVRQLVVESAQVPVEPLLSRRFEAET